MKKIPYALANFEALKQGDYYFVDKTQYIPALENNVCSIFLRPRRFGKSLWCSILECYYDISRAPVFHQLFAETNIGRSSTPSHSSNLVLKLNFSTVKASMKLEELEDSFDRSFANALDEFLFRYQKYFGDGHRIREQPNATERMKKLISMITTESLPRLYLIVDEYDNFTNQLLASMREADYKTLTTSDSFLRTFFKTIKAGCEDGAIHRMFMTGVLPVTIDDLTSGFNIGKNVSFRPESVSMLGFTEEEVVKYVDDVFADYGFDNSLKQRVLSDMKAYYDGYLFSPDGGEHLYNSTICNGYLQELISNGGRLPARTIDTNVKPDIAWLAVMERKGRYVEEFLQQIIGRNEAVPVSADKVYEQMSAGKFFSADYFAICLYYLGLLTFKDEFSLGVPNLSVSRILLDYYQEVHSAKSSALSNAVFSIALRDFTCTRDWKALFDVYWENYIRRVFPAKLFSYVNEAFFQILFFGFCIDRLSSRYSIRIEENHFSGTSDFLAVPMPGENAKICLLEFKYVSKKKVGSVTETFVNKAKAQAGDYLDDIRLRYPGHLVEGLVVIIKGNTGVEYHEL